MINHFRTLLLNVDGSAAPGILYPGEQYVPPTFRAKRLPALLSSARGLLLGKASDRAMLNWRLQDILSTIHGCQLDGYITGLDPRITYWPFNTSLLEKLLQGATAVKLAGGDDQQLQFVGGTTATVSVDKLLFQWILEVVSEDTVRVTYGGSTANLGYTITSGLSSIVDLPGSEMSVRFGEGVGAAWNIEVLASPKVAFGELLELADRGISDEARGYLFRGGEEPYKTFENLYLYHDQAPYRLAGLALAIGYRIDELPI